MGTPAAGVNPMLVSMQLPSRPFFFANQLDQLTIAPDSVDVAAPHVEFDAKA